MDDGYVIPGLNESWTFMGAKLMEWVSGLCGALVFQELFITNVGRSMPLIIMVLVGVPFALSNWRQMYPDEERGIRNQLMTLVGLAPPGIPRPSALQPLWSGLPVQELSETNLFRQLELDKVFNLSKEEHPEAESF